MPIPFLNAIDLNKNELQNARVQNLSADPSTPVEGQIYYNTTVHCFRYYNGTVWINIGRLDLLTLATASVSLNSQLITNLATPVSATDAATKAYVDGVAQGLDAKASVRVATAVAGTLASSFANGQVVDGITLATNDRILLKNQAAPAENGIYTVNAAGAPTRATDMAAWTQVPGAFTFVEVGTAGADTGWVCTADQGGTLGTAAITFVQFSSAGTFTASGGITKTGNDFALSTMAALTLKGNSTGGVAAPTDLTMATVKTMLGITGEMYANIGDGATLAYTVNHNLGSRDVEVQIYRVASPFETIWTDVERTDTNNVLIRFAVAPTTNQFRVVIK